MRTALINLINKWACAHSWDTYATANRWEKGIEMPVEVRHTIVCVKCGKIKKIQL